MSAVPGRLSSGWCDAVAAIGLHGRLEPIIAGSAGTSGASSAAGLPPNQLFRFFRSPSDFVLDKLKPLLLRFDFFDSGVNAGWLMRTSENAAL